VAWSIEPQVAFQFETQNISGVMSQECLAAHADEPRKCMYVDVNSPYVQTPLFLWQSAQDSNQLAGDLYPPCNETDCAVRFADSILKSMQATVFAKQQNGGFIDYCKHHCEKEPGIISDAGYTRGQALAMWYEGSVSVQNQTASFDQSGFPCESCCRAPVLWEAV